MALGDFHPSSSRGFAAVEEGAERKRRGARVALRQVRREGVKWKGKGISEEEPRQKDRPLNPRFSIGKYETHFRRRNVQPKDDLSVNIAYEIKGIEYVSVIVRRTMCNRTEMIRPDHHRCVR